MSKVIKMLIKEHMFRIIKMLINEHVFKSNKKC